MRAALSWLRDYVDLPAERTGREVAERLTEAGLKVESVTSPADAVAGPLLVGRVRSFSEETHSNGKTIRWCTVDVGEDEPRGIVCGALNFAENDPVAVALPGTVLPGGFAIAARKTYGHVSDGMICSARELAIGEDHAGILVLDTDAAPGADALEVLGMRDEVLDLEVTPDRGYALSMRGVAREVAIAYDLPFTDPGLRDTPPADADGFPVRVEDVQACDRFTARVVTGLDVSAPTPGWMLHRLQTAGMRPISLAVDVTNYVMLETGQPIHGYDRARLTGEILVRRGRPGERVSTLDGVDRAADPDDLLITDGSGPIGLAGVMGGASTEMSATTTDVVIEAAHFDPVVVARAARRHRLPSEASRRFERGVDRALTAVAADRVVELLAALGSARPAAGVTDVAVPPQQRLVLVPAGRVSGVAGRDVPVEVVTRRLTQVGCAVQPKDGLLEVTPPSWRPDLTDPADLDEEVLRLEGYHTIPSTLPTVPAGRGLTVAQRIRRRVSRALAAAGYAETPGYPFVGTAGWDALGIPADDPRRNTMRVANPISDAEAELRSTLLPGLLATLRRNLGRGQDDLALFETGSVFLPAEDIAPRAPRLRVDRRPSDDELAEVQAALPYQPTRVAVALSGQREQPGWWGPGRPAEWADAVEAARLVAGEVGVPLEVRRGAMPPWHPGRCAELVCAGTVVGHAGELHPGALTAFGLPARTCAAEIDLDALLAAVDAGTGPPLVAAPAVSTYPVAKEDVSLVVAADVPAADVESALRHGAGDLLESVRLFDVYTGDQVPAGNRSLTFALRFRAADRTLTVEESSAARDAAVAAAASSTGAVLRSV